MGKIKDKTGMVFGSLKVIERADDYFDENNTRHIMWKCLNELGEILNVDTSYLTNSHIDCCKNELPKKRKFTSRESKRKTNTYDLTSFDYGVGYDSNNNPFYFDKEDYDKICGYCWMKSIDDYIIARSRNNLKYIKLHRLLLNVLETPEKRVDHINKQRNDCRKDNLRICSNDDNLKNKTVYANNKSGVAGVRHTRHSTWESLIKVDHKDKRLGTFKTFDEAVYARLVAEKEYFGEYAPQRVLWEQYGIIDDLPNKPIQEVGNL